MPNKAAERVERAIAEGKAPAREDLETLIAAGRKFPVIERWAEAIANVCR